MCERDKDTSEKDCLGAGCLIAAGGVVVSCAAPRMLVVKGLPHPAAPAESADKSADESAGAAGNVPEIGDLEGEQQAELRYGLSQHLKSYKVVCVATRALLRARSRPVLFSYNHAALMIRAASLS